MLAADELDALVRSIGNVKADILKRRRRPRKNHARGKTVSLLDPEVGRHPKRDQHLGETPANKVDHPTERHSQHVTQFVESEIGPPQQWHPTTEYERPEQQEQRPNDARGELFRCPFLHGESIGGDAG